MLYNTFEFATYLFENVAIPQWERLNFFNLLR